MPIDMHSHWWPKSVVEALRARSIPPLVERTEDGADLLRITRGAIRLESDHSDLDDRLAIMDRNGLDKAVFSMPGAGIDNISVEEAAPLTRLFNDGIAEACGKHAGRFAGFATLPCDDISAAVEEFERVITKPGIIGALLPGSRFFSHRAAAPMAPLFEVAQRHRAHMFVHPSPLPEDRSRVPGEDLDNATQRRATLDNQAQISSILTTLCLTDFLDPYPDVSVQVPNLGGNIALEIERMDHICLHRTPGSEPPSKRIQRCYIDCNSFGPRGIELAVAVFGPDRVLLGTDGTTFGSNWSLEAVAKARIDETAREAILHKNAIAVLTASQS